MIKRTEAKGVNRGMKRRQFIRVMGGTALTTSAVPGYLFTSSAEAALKSFDDQGVLLEAALFENQGGWVLDTQHYHQMGGNYLLAHGSGQQVQNASSQVKLPEAGEWYVFVRTRDWCPPTRPGEWQSPGRFKVLIDGQPLKPVFGTEPGWAWQSGGSVKINAASCKVELQDMTGFEGRVDAIYFSKSASPKLPNDDLVVLSQWKDRITGRDQKQIETYDYDLVIVGGGQSGCGAALAARREGLKVALIQDRPLFGGNASEEIRVHTLGIHGASPDIIKTIDTKHWPNGHDDAKKDQIKREKTMAESGVDLYAHHAACGLSKAGSRIESVEAREITTGLIKRFKAPVFLDASGDGWLGFWAGAEFSQGRESWKKYDERWEEKGDLWAPEKPDNKVMGTSVLWFASKQKQGSRFPKVPWAMPVAKNHQAVKGEWYWEYSNNDLDQIQDAEEIRDHMFRAIYGSFFNAKKHPKNATYALAFVAYVGGKRESRRLHGDYIYTMKDATELRKFEDTVVVEKRDLDTHYQRKETGAPVDFLSKALFLDPHGIYHIPFRCFYSKDIDNLMMAGRCFSCSHIGLTGPRVMNTCAQMGIATGFAAALCKKYEMTPREVGQNHIKELQQLIGMDRFLDNPSTFTPTVYKTERLRLKDSYEASNIPEKIKTLPWVTGPRGKSKKPALGYNVRLNQAATAYLAVHQRGDVKLPDHWVKTEMTMTWGDGKYTDVIYKAEFKKGWNAVPGHNGKEGVNYGIPNLVAIEGSDPKKLKIVAQ